MWIRNIKKGDGATVLIGPDISVQLVRAKEGSVQIRIEAPKERIVVVETDSEPS